MPKIKEDYPDSLINQINKQVPLSHILQADKQNVPQCNIVVYGKSNWTVLTTCGVLKELCPSKSTEN